MDSNRSIALIEDNGEDIFFMQHVFEAAGIPNPPIILENGRATLPTEAE
jgi:hypothetical protein